MWDFGDSSSSTENLISKEMIVFCLLPDENWQDICFTIKSSVHCYIQLFSMTNVHENWCDVSQQSFRLTLRIFLYVIEKRIVSDLWFLPNKNTFVDSEAKYSVNTSWPKHRYVVYYLLWELSLHRWLISECSPCWWRGGKSPCSPCLIVNTSQKAVFTRDVIEKYFMLPSR